MTKQKQYESPISEELTVELRQGCLAGSGSLDCENEGFTRDTETGDWF